MSTASHELSAVAHERVPFRVILLDKGQTLALQHGTVACRLGATSRGHHHSPPGWAWPVQSLPSLEKQKHVFPEQD
jgi:hypothetical protein